MLSDTMETIGLDDSPLMLIDSSAPSTDRGYDLSPVLDHLPISNTLSTSTSGRRVPSPVLNHLPMRSRLIATRSADVMELSRTITNHWDPDASFEL